MQIDHVYQLNLLKASHIIQTLLNFLDKYKDNAREDKSSQCIYEFIHLQFLSAPFLVHLIHCQGYPSTLIPEFLANVPSTRDATFTGPSSHDTAFDVPVDILLDTISTVIQEAKNEQQLIFKLTLLAHLARLYPLPKS